MKFYHMLLNFQYYFHFVDFLIFFFGKLIFQILNYNCYVFHKKNHLYLRDCYMYFLFLKSLVLIVQFLILDLINFYFFQMIVVLFFDIY